MVTKRNVLLTLAALAACGLMVSGVFADTPNDHPIEHDPTMSAVITNGTIKLGVRDEGHLNIPSAGIPSRPSSSTTAVGLRLIFPDGSESEATAPGCLCEGWGASAGAVSGYATVDNAFPGIGNLSFISFTSTDGFITQATSVVEVGTVLRVTHDYHPSATAFLYEATVTLENISGADITDLRYRRVMDWDISPTTFNEYVTINSGSAVDLVTVTDNGFDDPDPLSPPSTPGTFSAGDRVDDGPRDHGALFQFEFQDINAATPLPDGGTKVFNIYYGATFNEPDAIAALAAVGAEAFSFGQPNTDPPADHGEPNTFIFAFSGVGGAPIFGDPCTVICQSPFECGGASTTVTLEGTGSSNTGDPVLLSWDGDCPVADPSAASTTADCDGTGDYNFTLTVTVDANGNGIADDDEESVSCNGLVTVQDTEPPMFAAPGDQTLECADGAADASLMAAASDVCDGTNFLNSRTGASSDASGSYNLGDNTVAWIVADDSGNASAGWTNVTVVDTTPPDVACGSQIVTDDEDDELTQVLLSTSDACCECGSGAVIDIGCATVAVSDGELIDLVCRDHGKCTVTRDDDGVLELRTSSALLTVQASDCAGNSNDCVIELCPADDDEGADDPAVNLQGLGQTATSGADGVLDLLRDSNPTTTERNHTRERPSRSQR